jgi:hypothetical protein
MRYLIIPVMSSLLHLSLNGSQEPERPLQISVEALWLKRDRSENQNLVDWNGTFCSSASTVNHLTSKQLIDDLDRDLALRISFEVTDRDKGTLQIRGTTPFNFSSTVIEDAAGSMQAGCQLSYGYLYNSNPPSTVIPVFNTEEQTTLDLIPYYNTDYIDANQSKTTLTTNYYTIETNYYSHLSMRWKDYFSVSVGGGLRYFSYRETLEMAFTKSINPLVPVLFGTSSARSSTHNQLYGAQLLFDFHMHPYSWLDFGIALDAGGMAARQKSINRIDDLNASVTLKNSSIQRLAWGFFGDLEVFARVRLLQQALLMASFGGTYINGVAQANTNFNMTQTHYGVSDEGAVFFQWWSAGLGWNF